MRKIKKSERSLVARAICKQSHGREVRGPKSNLTAEELKELQSRLAAEYGAKGGRVRMERLSKKQRVALAKRASRAASKTVTHEQRKAWGAMGGKAKAANQASKT